MKFPHSFLKVGAKVLVKPLCNLVNWFKKQCTFHDKCTVAKLNSLFIKGSRTDPKKLKTNFIDTCYIENNQETNTHPNARLSL